MTAKLLRGMLNALGIVLVLAWAVGAFFVAWHGWFGVAAAAAFLTAGYMQFCDKMRDLHQFRREGEELNAHFESTVTHAPHHAVTVIEGGRDPDWRDEHRPTWETDIFGAPE